MDETRDAGKLGATDQDAWPSLDRSAVLAANLTDESDEKAFWQTKTPEERLQAMELMRQIAYGYDPATIRLQRVLEVVELKAG